MWQAWQHFGQYEGDMRPEFQLCIVCRILIWPYRLIICSFPPWSSGLLVPTLLTPLPSPKNMGVKSFLPWQGSCFVFQEAFLNSGEFLLFLLGEVASSFPKNIPHLLFKQSALEELWSLEEGCGYCEILSLCFDASWKVPCLQAVVWVCQD